MQQLNKAGILLNSLEICSILQWSESSSYRTSLHAIANHSQKVCLIYVAKSWNRTKVFFEITLIALIKISKSFSKSGAEKGKNFNTRMEKELLCKSCHSWLKSAQIRQTSFLFMEHYEMATSLFSSTPMACVDGTAYRTHGAPCCS